MKSKLEECRSQLSLFCAGLEPLFIHLGSELESLSVQANGISDQAKSATELEGGKNLNELFLDVRQIVEGSLETLDKTITASARAARLISDVGTGLKSVSHKHRALEKLSSMTKMLGISSRIQSSRLGHIGASFSFVSEQVGSFSRTLHAYASALKTEIEQALIKIANVEASIAGRLDDHQGEYTTTSERMGDILDLAAKASVKMARTSDEINIFSEGVAKEIAAIVSALQFQDITRQQMEHVQDSLCEIRASLSETDLQNCDSAELSPPYTSLTIQISQLSNVRQKVRNARKDIVDALSKIENNVHHHVNYIAGAMGGDDNGQNSALVMLNNFIAALKNQLRNSLSLSEELFTAVKSVSELVETIGNNQDKIDEVCMDMKILAINALAQAAPLGIEGSRLSVISGDMKSLADAWAVKAQELVTELQGMVGLAKNLEAELFELLQTTEQKTTESQERYAKSLLLVQAADQKVSATVRNMNKSSQALGDRVASILRNFAFESTDSELDKIILSLEQVRDLIGDNLSPREKASINTAPTTQVDRYTMECERRTHMHTLDGISETHLDDTDELGDNVELF